MFMVTQLKPSNRNSSTAQESRDRIELWFHFCGQNRTRYFPKEDIKCNKDDSFLSFLAYLHLSNYIYDSIVLDGNVFYYPFLEHTS